MAYPTAIELAEFCYDAKIITSFPVDYTQYELAIEAAVQTWERQINWSPFLGESEDSTTTFRHSHGRMIDFRGGYVSVTSVTFDTEASTAVENSDYEFGPENKSPKRWLMLYRMPSEKVTIVGKKGFAAELPDDVKQAILAYGASLIYTQSKSSGIASEVRQGDVVIKYSEGTSEAPNSQYGQWKAIFKEVSERYRRGFM